MLEPDEYRRQADRLLVLAAALDGVPKEDPFEDGQVITFAKPGRDYVVLTYAALKANGMWFITGRSENLRYKSWESLVYFIEPHNLYTVHVVTQQQPLGIWVSKQKEEADESPRTTRATE